MTRATNAKRLVVAAMLVLLAPVGAQISALALSATIAALLTALALWELRTPVRHGARTRLAAVSHAAGGVLHDLRYVQHQQEGTP